MPMRSNQVFLGVHPEVVDGVSRVQVGGFSEHIGGEDARLLAEFAFSIGRSHTDPKQIVVLALHCSGGASAEIALRTQSFRSDLKWQVCDERSAALRLVRLSSVSMRIDVESVADLAAILPIAWPAGRVVLGAGTRSIDIGSTSWMNEGVDPPRAIIQGFECVIVSFFHGDWVAVYEGDASAPAIAEQILRIGSSLGRPMRLTEEPF
jgi:hypothetical protein